MSGLESPQLPSAPAERALGLFTECWQKCRGSRTEESGETSPPGLELPKRPLGSVFQHDPLVVEAVPYLVG